MRGEVHVRVARTLAELRPFRAAWTRLLRGSPTRTVFQSLEWLECWRQAGGEDSRLVVPLVFIGRELVAAAPLAISESRSYGGLRRSLGFATGSAADYQDFLYRDEAALELLVETIRTRLDWDVLELDRMPEASPSPQALARAFPGWSGTLFPCDVGAAYVFGGASDGSDILGKKKVQAYLRGLRKAGVVEVSHLRDPAAIAAELPAFMAQHVRRRQAAGLRSEFLEPGPREFYRLLVERLGRQQWLLFTRVCLDGVPVACHFGFDFDDRLMFYKPTFSIEHAKHSPGQVLIAELFRYCQGNRLREFDFTIGDHPYKERFSNERRRNLQFRAYRNGVLQRLDRASRDLRERAKKVDAIRQLHSRLRGVRSRIQEGAST